MVKNQWKVMTVAEVVPEGFATALQDVLNIMESEGFAVEHIEYMHHWDKSTETMTYVATVVACKPPGITARQPLTTHKSYPPHG
jgi:hypothetical protein